jgi:hypothetical protein
MEVVNPLEYDRDKKTSSEFHFQAVNSYTDKAENDFLYESENLNDIPPNTAFNKDLSDHAKFECKDMGPARNFLKPEAPKEPHFYYSMHQVPSNMFKQAQPANNGLGLKPFQMHQLNPQSLIPFTAQQQQQHFQQYQQHQTSYRLGQKNELSNEYTSDDDEDV